MSTHTISLPAGRVPATLRAAQLLLALLGAIVTFGAIYFSAFVPEDVAEPANSLGDWLVGAWALATGVGALYCAARLAGPDARVRRAARWLMATHVVFGLVKVVAYSEAEAVPFIVIDLVLIALLSTRAVTCWRSTAR
jgi:hypothetical protein